MLQVGATERLEDITGAECEEVQDHVLLSRVNKEIRYEMEEIRGDKRKENITQSQKEAIREITKIFLSPWVDPTVRCTVCAPTALPSN